METGSINMIFGRFHERALGSRVKVRLLRRILNEDMSVSERELASLVGVSHTAVSKAMRDFQDIGLVTPVHVGNALLWRTSKESHAYGALSHMFRKEPLERVVELVAERMGKYREVGKVVLFGAAIEGREERGSAIELLVVLDPKVRYEGFLKSSLDRAFFEMDRECRALFGNGVAAHVASVEEISSKYKDAVRKGLSVIG
jgi:predicted transcriptional regulator